MVVDDYRMATDESSCRCIDGYRLDNDSFASCVGKTTQHRTTHSIEKKKRDNLMYVYVSTWVYGLLDF